ncbi:hypothetical protein [Pseudomonas chlororaphis]|uniref:hypothetical protein n=1 Tax=Pseudomonas chlororaphis TaxID=587753 RepID=UPI0011D12475|nr:hypothetical protein [Pseudomonas chlororaphis]
MDIFLKALNFMAFCQKSTAFVRPSGAARPWNASTPALFGALSLFKTAAYEDIPEINLGITGSFPPLFRPEY